MKTRCELMQIIQKYDFALYDLTLYLDTHTQCTEALALFDKYRTMRDKAVEEYTQRFGALRAERNQNSRRWEWGKGPYPWEREAN